MSNQKVFALLVHFDTGARYDFSVQLFYDRDSANRAFRELALEYVVDLSVDSTLGELRHALAENYNIYASIEDDVPIGGNEGVLAGWLRDRIAA